MMIRLSYLGRKSKVYASGGQTTASEPHTVHRKFKYGPEERVIMGVLRLTPRVRISDLFPKMGQSFDPCFLPWATDFFPLKSTGTREQQEGVQKKVE